MPISGNIPSYNIGTSADTITSGGAVVASCAGSLTSGSFANQADTETLQQFFRRAIGILAGKTAGAISSGTVSGLHNLQLELAARVTDIEYTNGGNYANVTSGIPQLRTAYANAILTASGEVA